jgi:hypothetical protein
MERLLELLIKQSLAEGYEISKEYGQEMLTRSSWKLVPALAAVKSDIDKRMSTAISPPYSTDHLPGKSALKSSGRIRWPASNNLVDLKPEIRRATSAYSTPMKTLDQILNFLELEDNHLKHVLTQQSLTLSPYFKDLVKNYTSKKARDEAFAAYSAEAKFRDAREKFCKESKKKGLKGGDLTKAMHGWDLEHDGDADFKATGLRMPLDAQPDPIQTTPLAEARADGYVPPTVEDASDEDDVLEGPCEDCEKPLVDCECDSGDEDDENDEDELDEELEVVLDLVWGNTLNSVGSHSERSGKAAKTNNC